MVFARPTHRLDQTVDHLRSPPGVGPADGLQPHRRAEPSNPPTIAPTAATPGPTRPPSRYGLRAAERRLPLDRDSRHDQHHRPGRTGAYAGRRGLERHPEDDP